MQTKQTVVDWLAKELYTKMEMKGSGEVFDEIIKQANKIFQHQIINAFDEGQEYEYQYHINNAPKFYSETYFSETYGSKGSDEVVSFNKDKRFSEDDMWEIFVRGMGAVKSEELGLISAKELFDKYINNITK